MTQPTLINFHPNEYLHLNVLSMITEINESKIFTKDISCECKCKFDAKKSNSDQKWNNAK